MDGNTKSWARSKHKQSERQKKRHGKGQRGRSRGTSSGAGAPGAQHPPATEPYEEGSEEDESGDETQDGSPAVSTPPAQGTSTASTAANSTDVSQPKLRGKYSRRQITSNHDRYQELGSDDEEPSRGADMRTLLAQAGSTGSGAHMLLKGEAELDAEAVGAFELDCTKLAASLRTLPLALRLDLRDTIYLPELAVLDASGMRTAAPVGSSGPGSKAASPNFSTSVSPSSVAAATPAPLLAVAYPSISPSPSTVTPKATMPATRPPPTKKESEDLSDLDALLASKPPAPTPTKQQAPVAAAAPTKPAAPKAQGGKDLEDWLDSVI